MLTFANIGEARVEIHGEPGQLARDHGAVWATETQKGAADGG